jgi:hypothetical protein
MSGIPSGTYGPRSLVSSIGFIDSCVGLLTAVIGGLATVSMFDEHHPVMGVVAVLATVAAIVLLFVRIVRQYRDEVQRDNPHALEGCIHTVWTLLKQSADARSPGARIRGTIHVPVGVGIEQVLLQVVDYVGDERKRKSSAGRKFPVHCGVIGQAFCTGEMAFGERKNDNYNKYLDELVKDWAYTQDQALELDKDANSWLAIPIVRRPGNSTSFTVDCIVYFDSTSRGFFDDEKLALAVSSCAGITHFIDQYYRGSTKA